MTRDKDFKTKVRERMARTGERYTAARAQLVAQRPRDVVAKLRDGVHPETTALVRVLAAAGVSGPDRTPITESLVLGLGGGIGAACFVFDYKGHAPTFYVATRCQPQYAYDAVFVTTAARRLGAAVDVFETTSANLASKALRERTARGPAIAWLDRAGLPWSPRVPGSELGAMPHVVVVQRVGEDTATVLDTPAKPFEIPLADLAAARKRMRAGKHRLATVTNGKPVDPREAIADAIASCAGELRGKTKVKGPMAKNFGIAGLRRWHEALVDDKGPRRFTKVFPPRFAATALADTRALIEHAGTGGGAFRPLYADFLDEAATIAKRPALRALAKTYRSLGAEWTAFSTALLPDALGLAEVRAAQDARSAAFARGDVTAMHAAEASYARAITAIRELAPDDLASHYRALGARLAPILDAEQAAADALGGA